MALWIAGMPAWNSLNHAMTGITTGGFSVTDGSIGFYQSGLIEVVLIPIMLFGAISFTFHYNLLTGRFKELKEDIQTKWLLILTAAGIGLITVTRFLTGVVLEHFRNSTFQFVSAISCTGFQTAVIDEWAATGKMLMVAGMVIGGRPVPLPEGSKSYERCLYSKVSAGNLGGSFLLLIGYFNLDSAPGH